MTERPILFSGAMVKALLAGTKTQTRRVVKPQPDFDTAREALGGDTSSALIAYDHRIGGIGLRRGGGMGYVQPNIHCPYGAAGDRLWVKELHRTYATYDHESFTRMQERLALIPAWMPFVVPLQYDADGARVNWDARDAKPGKGRPSIHMPRWASRITLEISEVRAERLQDISEEDAIAEGLSQGVGCWWNAGEEYMASPTPKGAYALLWNQINGPGSWDANPWVWCVSFRRIDVPRSMGGTG